MTVAYALGVPRPAASRGGDCRAIDLGQSTYSTESLDALTDETDDSLTDESGDALTSEFGALLDPRNVHGHHRFAATTDCRISNGLISLTVGASGAAPSLTIEAYRGGVIVGDLLSDILSDTLPGSSTAPAWSDMGTLTIDSPAVPALLTGVRIAKVNDEAITLRLVAPAIGDVDLTLRRFYRSVFIQHGSTRGAPVTTTRRIRLTGPPSITGTASAGRVEEAAPTIEGFPRFAVALDPVATADAGAFSMTSPAATTFRFGAGVATLKARDLPYDHHRQLADASRPMIVLESV